jgi:hypothetical protein
MDDIDLLLPRSAVVPAAKMLERAGWKRAQHPGRVGYDIPFTHPAVPGIPLELHFDFAEWHDRSQTLSGRRLWALRRSAVVFGQEAYVLPTEVEIVASLAHAAKGYHCFARLLWIADVVVSARSAPVDWDEVARIATDARRRVVTAIGLAQARGLGADVPLGLTTLPAHIARTPAIQALLDDARPFTTPGGPTRSLPYALTDDVPGLLRHAIGDVRMAWQSGGATNVREVLTFLVRGLVRTRIRPKRRDQRPSVW